MKTLLKNSTLALATLLSVTFTTSAFAGENKTKKESKAELFAAEIPALEAMFLGDEKTVDSTGVMIFNQNFEVVFEKHFVAGQETKEVKTMIENSDLILVENGIRYYQKR